MGIKILHMSDLHLDENEFNLERSLFNEFISFLKIQTYDLLLISGDLSNKADLSIWYLDEIERLTGKKVLFVPGNHDIYLNKGDKNSWEVLNKFRNHSSNLLNNPHILGDWAIVGGFSWYDYSYRLDGVSEVEAEEFKNLYWGDAGKVHFGMSDIDVTDKMLYELELDLSKVIDKKVWLMNHFVPYSDFITYRNNVIWNNCSAFLGSEEVGRLLNRYDNVKVVSFGHTHTPFEGRHKDNKIIVCNPLGYSTEWSQLDFTTELSRRAFFYELS